MQPQISYDIIPPSVADWTPGRVSFDYIGLHTTDCSKQVADQVFHSGTRQASAHRIAGEDGSILVEVSDGDTAWGLANWYVNQRGLSLECEDMGNPNDSTRTDALYAAAAWQVADWCRRYGIPCVKVGVDGNRNPVARGIVLHREVSQTGTACPDGLDWARIIRQAQALLGGELPPAITTPSNPDVTTHDPKKVRVLVQTLRVHNIPGRGDAGNYGNTPDGMVHLNQLVDISGWIHGETVTQDGKTSDIWLHTTNGHYIWAADTDYDLNQIPKPAPPTPPVADNPNQVPFTPASGTYTITASVGAHVRALPNTASAVNQGTGDLDHNVSFDITGFTHGQDVDLSGSGGAHTDIWLRSIHGNWIWAGATNYPLPAPAAPAPTPPPAPAVPAPAVVPAASPSQPKAIDIVVPQVDQAQHELINAADKLTTSQEVTGMVAAIYGAFLKLKDNLSNLLNKGGK